MKRIDAALLPELAARAHVLPRLRTHHNLHPDLTDPVQRLLNVIEPGSYVRPHRHTAPARWELFVALAGAAAVLLFDEEGVVLERVVIAPDGETRIVELPPGGWHTVVALRPGTVLFEVKPGPYAPLPPEDCAAWAPAEGDARCAALAAWFATAGPGERAP